MDFPNPDIVTVKLEPGTGGEGGGGPPDSDIVIDIPNIKKECLEYSQESDLTSKKYTLKWCLKLFLK